MNGHLIKYLYFVFPTLLFENETENQVNKIVAQGRRWITLVLVVVQR